VFKWKLYEALKIKTEGLLFRSTSATFVVSTLQVCELHFVAYRNEQNALHL